MPASSPTRVAARWQPLEISLVWLALAALAALAAQSVPANAAESYRVGGDRQAVYNLAGSMIVLPGSGDEVVVEVSRAGADAGRLKVETSTIRGRQALRVLYPSDHIVDPQLGHGQRTTLSVRDDSTFGGHNSDFGLLSRRVTIRGSGDGLEAHADLRVFVPRDGQVDVYLGVGVVHITNVRARLSVDVAAADVTAAGTRGSLAIDTGSGDVTVHDATGPLSMDTGSGRVEVEGARGGDVAIDTGSGSVGVRDVDAERLAIDTGSGSVTVDQLRTRQLKVDTGSGSVDIELLTDVDDVMVDTGSGGATLRVPRDLGATLALQTGNGDFDVDLPMSHLHRSEGELQGVVGDGRGRISVETGSGSIAIHSR